MEVFIAETTAAKEIGRIGLRSSFPLLCFSQSLHGWSWGITCIIVTYLNGVILHVDPLPSCLVPQEVCWGRALTERVLVHFHAPLLWGPEEHKRQENVPWRANETAFLMGLFCDYAEPDRVPVKEDRSQGLIGHRRTLGGSRWPVRGVGHKQAERRPPLSRK